MTKAEIFNHLSENPEHILCELVKDDFKLAKLIWGEDEVLYGREPLKEFYKSKRGGRWSRVLHMPDYQFHLQLLVLEPDQLKYLQGFLEGEKK